jgi:hypothetical protein
MRFGRTYLIIAPAVKANTYGNPLVNAKDMNDASDKPWNGWLTKFKQRFIKANKWTDKEAKLHLRDGWAVVRDGRVHILEDGSQRPANAVPVFQMLTPGGWKLPIWILEALTGLVGKALSSGRAPQDIVLGLLGKIAHCDSQEESDEVKAQRHKAAFFGYQLLDACEDATLAGVIESDVFWQAVLHALQAGYHHAILELYRDPQLLADLVTAQSFQAGRKPDELSRYLEASWLDRRAVLGRDPNPSEVAKAAGGVWSEIDDCWEFDDLAGLPSLTSGALYDRLERIRHKHS